MSIMNVFYAGAQYLSANKRRVAFLSLAGAGAVAAYAYARRQYGAMTAALDAERLNGARSLRAVYLASRRTVVSTLRALLAPGRERVFACDEADPDSRVNRLQMVSNAREKKETWEELKIVAIVRLVVSVYYLVEVYLVLLVQVNLVARYSTADMDAPIEGLSGGKLELESKQRFLSLARRKLFEQGGIEELVRIVHLATTEVVGPVKLTEKVGPDAIRGILRDICRKVESLSGLNTAAGSNVNGTGLFGPNSSATSTPACHVLDARWLLMVPPDGDPESSSESDIWDSNVRQLVSEGLDICDVLDYDALVKSTVDALMDVAGGLVNGYVFGVSSGDEDGGKVALAPVIAKVANVSKAVLGNGAGIAGADDLTSEGPSGDGPFVDALLQVGSCDAFGAAVFLSGERTGATLS